MITIGIITNLNIAIYITIIAFFNPWKVALGIKNRGKAGKPNDHIFK
mgnify:CR=1 FL=1